jgi:predicted ATPase/DNA-binding NarL/FixJ family response regulator
MAKPVRRLGNLPAEASSFVGRRREVADLRSKLSASRVVTVVGPGGVGKTRLAVRVAADLARGAHDGSWLVGLADVRDPALVPNVTAAALDLRDQAGADPRSLVLAHLRERQVLLLVDNCEHLLDAAARFIAEIVAMAPGVRVLATSREPLGIPGEQMLPLTPFEAPADDPAPSVERLAQNDAVRLFVARAAAASGSFALIAANAAAVTEVCRRLDGLPLALELAAARTRVLGIEQIRDRLADRFALLTHGSRTALPRHQTLQAAIDWSYDLLSDPERALLRGLGVFAGRFTLEDVEAVCATDDAAATDVVDLLGSLVEQSLVIAELSGGVATYRLHETMRAYARARLEAAPEAEAAGGRFAGAVVARCRRSIDEAQYALPEWLAWMDLELDNVRAVLHRSVEDNSWQGLAVAGSLGWYWSIRATTEGVRWLDELLPAAGDLGPADETQQATLGWALFTRGFLAIVQGDRAVAAPVLDRAVAAAESAELPTLIAIARAAASVGANLDGDRETAARLLDEAKRSAARQDDPAATLSLAHAEALNALFGRDLATVIATSTAGEQLSRELGALYVRELMLTNLGFAALATQDPAARSYLDEGLRIARAIDDRVGQAYLLGALAALAAGQSRAQHAARLLGASESIRESGGATVIAGMAPFLAQASAAATAALGESRFATELAAGRGLDRGAAIALALGDPIARARTIPARRAEAALGEREAEVAALIADGLTNREIGARLFISERTVDSHVRNMLNKLGFDSRTQIAAWVRSGS